MCTLQFTKGDLEISLSCENCQPVLPCVEKKLDSVVMDRTAATILGTLTDFDRNTLTLSYPEGSLPKYLYLSSTSIHLSIFFFYSPTSNLSIFMAPLKKLSRKNLSRSHKRPETVLPHRIPL